MSDSLKDLTALSLLPPGAGIFEKVFSAALARRVASRLMLVAVLRTLWDPWRCPAEQLPYLAWAWSVDIWEEDWPELKKRQVVADARRLHRIKTTLAGIRAHLKLVNCEIIKAVRPPATGWHTSAMTDRDRRAWLESLPQIRIYPFATRATAIGRSFLCGSWGHAFHGRLHMQASRGPALYGRRATYADHGTEIPVRLTTFVPPGGTPADRIMLARQGARRLFHRASWLGHGFLTGSTADRAVVTVRLAGDGFHNAVASGTRIADVRPERIAQGRIAPAGRGFFGKRGGFMLTSFAPLLIYDRIALIEEPRLVLRRKVRTFHGYGRFGIKPYHAELTVSVPMHRPKPRLGRFLTGYLKAASMRPLDRALYAVRVSKAARDTIHISTTTHRTLRLSDRPRLGAVRLGEIRRIV